MGEQSGGEAAQAREAQRSLCHQARAVAGREAARLCLERSERSKPLAAEATGDSG